MEPSLPWVHLWLAYTIEIIFRSKRVDLRPIYSQVWVIVQTAQLAVMKVGSFPLTVTVATLGYRSYNLPLIRRLKIQLGIALDERL